MNARGLKRGGGTIAQANETDAGYYHCVCALFEVCNDFDAHAMSMGRASAPEIANSSYY